MSDQLTITRNVYALLVEAKRERNRLRDSMKAMRPYVQHRSTCILNISQSVLRESSWCDCGLREALADAASNTGKEPAE